MDFNRLHTFHINPKLGMLAITPKLLYVLYQANVTQTHWLAMDWKVNPTWGTPMITHLLL